MRRAEASDFWSWSKRSSRRVQYSRPRSDCLEPNHTRPYELNLGSGCEWDARRPEYGRLLEESGGEVRVSRGVVNMAARCGGYAVRPMAWPMLLHWDGCGWNRGNGMPLVKSVRIAVTYAMMGFCPMKTVLEGIPLCRVGGVGSTFCCSVMFSSPLLSATLLH